MRNIFPKIRKNKTIKEKSSFHEENSLNDFLDSFVKSDFSEEFKNRIDDTLKFLDSNSLGSSNNFNFTSPFTVVLPDADAPVDSSPNLYSMEIQFLDNFFFISLFKDVNLDIDYSKVPYFTAERIHYASIKVQSQDLFSALYYLVDKK
jgi:hypothetical protein